MEVNSILSSTVGVAERSGTRLAEDFDDFLVLLTAQLQAQDPLDPMDSSDFTQQLVQFTGVEQQIQSNKNLENIAALLAFNGMTAAVSFLGKDVTVNQDIANLRDGTAVWVYELKANAAETTLEVVDKNGDVVRTLEGPVDSGLHGFVWDGFVWNGIDAFDQQAPDGPYKLRVKAINVLDQPVPTNVYLRNRVDNIEMVGGEALLSVNGFRVPITSVLSVSDQQPVSSATDPATDPAV